MNTIDESGETLIASESSSSSSFVSDHVVLSSSTIQEAQNHEVQQLMMGEPYPAAFSVMGQRPSLIVRQWLDDVKRRASQLVNNPPLSPNRHASDDEYFLVPDSALTSDYIDEVEGLDVSMRVDIHSDPMVELMLENRIIRLESDLQACELQYEERIQSLAHELQEQSMAHIKQKSILQSHIKDLEGRLASIQYEHCKLQETLASQQQKDSFAAVGRIQELEARLSSLQREHDTMQAAARQRTTHFEAQVASLQHINASLQDRENQRTKELEMEVASLRLENSSLKTLHHKRIADFEEQILSFQHENQSLRHSSEGMTSVKYGPQTLESGCPNKRGNPARVTSVEKLSPDQVVRYSRQLLLQDGFGVRGQCKLLSSSVLVVGAGGIGSTVLMYLAASGVGHISVIDFDQVDRSNLHRQVIHEDSKVGLNKAISACQAMKRLNPTIRCTPIQAALTFDNALELVTQHDCIVDASDNPQTRYLINDACVLAKKPLVSGSAMGTEGQLTVYNHLNGPCYRCLYPKPNISEGCKSCSDNGVLGPVPGLIGILQSLEVVKLLTRTGTTMNDRLLMYDALRCAFVNIKKPAKSPNCMVCGENATIHCMKDSKKASLAVRGPNVALEGCNLNIPHHLPSDLSISCTDYNQIRARGDEHVLIDVRVKQQFVMCSLEGAINIPLADLDNELHRLEKLSNGTKPIFCVCRRGIASIEATQIIANAMHDRSTIHSVKNISGGLLAWSKEVDSSFPKY